MAEPKVRFKRDDGSSYPDLVDKKLGDIGTVLMCKRVFREQTDSTGDVPFYKIGTFGGVPDAFISRELYEELKSKYSFPKKGNVLLSAAGTIGRTVRYDGEDAFFQDSNIVWLDHDDSVLDDYLYYFYQQASWKNLEGGTIQRLYNGILLDKDISIPSLEEQQRISDFLSSVDDVITASEEEVANFETQKKAVMKKIFSQEVRFKREDGSDFPEWEEKTLYDVADIVGGGTPDTAVDDYWKNGSVEWFTPTEVGHDKYVCSSKRKITNLGFIKSSARKLPAGTLLLTSRATIGEMSIAEKECCTNQGFQSLIVHDDIDNEFIYYCQPIIKKYGMKHAAGSTFLEISGTNIGKCPIKLPCLEEQHLISGFLSDFDEAIAAAKKELELWKELKKGLLQQMFV